MRISQLYVYPIKSLRPTRITESTLTSHGLPYDRRFMLLKVEAGKGDASPGLRNMQIAHFPEMALFQTDIDAEAGHVVVTYTPPASDKTRQSKNGFQQIKIPLDPDVSALARLEIDLHKSPTTGYDMGPPYNSWFTRCFGYPVILAHLGPHSREVLGPFAPGKQKYIQSGSSRPLWPLIGICLAHGAYWVHKIMHDGIPATILLVQTIVMAILGLGYYRFVYHQDHDRITFADCAPYLVISETSVSNVSSRLPDGEEMDLTKFRPNIVVSGADTAFEEDFWSILAIGTARTRLLLTANCLRCVSLNVDFSTGKMGMGRMGNVLKSLMGDRRVDSGVKYSPVFGRYSFLDGRCAEGRIQVGDEVVVEEKASERTSFSWPGITS
ncbi:MOSC domain protein [Aspergillus ambiguus]|uniref:MOSC domain-containing protein n=1 Tax=Aspergillus ambiguus TaxID=176160 RepID=UPI003CCD8BBD